jgi:hypothetical protein
MTGPDRPRTADEYRTRGDELLALANVHMIADRHDRAQSAATLAAAHFNAYGVLVEREQQPAAPGPGDALFAFLRTVRDNPVRTVGGAVVIADGSPPSFSWGRVAGVAEKAGLAVEDDERWWHLTARGREAAERGSV